MSLNQLKVPEIENVYLKIYQNACELISEAELLYNHEKYARGYLCAHIAIEEFGKLPMLFTIALRVYNNEKVDWKELNKRLRNHKSKTSQSYALLMLAENAFVKFKEVLATDKKHEKVNPPSNDLQGFKSFIEDDNVTLDISTMYKTLQSADLMEDFSKRALLSEVLNDYKNSSLYADYFEKNFVKPNEFIDEERCRKRISISLVQKKIVDMTDVQKDGFKLFKFDDNYKKLYSRLLGQLDKKE